MNSTFRNSVGIAAALAMLAGPALAQPYPSHGPQGQYQQQQPMHEPQHDANGQPRGDYGQQSHYAQHQPMHEPQHDAFDAPHGDYGHNGWHQGDHYNGGRQTVDWHRHHLRQPPPGYEWVQSGNQFVMIAVTSGIIASIIANAAR